MYKQPGDQPIASPAPLSPSRIARFKKSVAGAFRRNRAVAGAVPLPLHERTLHAPLKLSPVNINIRIVPSTKALDKATRYFTLPGTHPRTTSPLNALIPDDDRKLRKIEPEILKWLSANPDNVALFFANPVAALARSGVGIDVGLMRRIKRARRLQREESWAPRDFRIGKISISLGK